MAMNAVNAELKQARKKLEEALGDNLPAYWTVMKQWYRQKVDKDEFDNEAIRLLTERNVHLHNEFMVAIFTKCQTANFILDSNAGKGATSAVTPPTPAPSKVAKKTKSTKKKKAVVRATFENRFMPSDPMQYLPIEVSKPVANDKVDFCTKAACLPDAEMLHGRVFVTTWEWGLEGVTDSTVPLILHAIQHTLKSIISAMLSRQSAYEVRDGCFKHANGQYFTETTPQAKERENKADIQSSTDSPSSNIVSKLGVDEVEQKAVYRLATGGMAPMNKTLTLEDLLDAMLVNGRLLASHTVSSLAIERVLCSLWHPDQYQLDQDEKFRQQLAKPFSMDRR
ncbi:transcriptional adapter 1-like [Lytechinus pictus]|uniref:transcriptional adapter 1-like n=1 Tax=Lytechinus pictus TaxID=7653 RepID=UPI00240CFA68|nr:transcriptional adapter 1-like [Lytechinus pictus]